MEKEEKLKKMVNDLLWMAARYAHGRHTYAPGIVRQIVMDLYEMYPDFRVKEDLTIEPPRDFRLGLGLREDYLDDIFNGERLN